MRRGLGVLLAGVCAGVVGAGCGAAQEPAAAEPAAPARPEISLRRIATGLDDPVHVAAPRNERGRLYVVEQPGRIRVIVNGRLRAQPFLDIRSLVLSGGEQGLLSVAFHPRYAQNRRFYVDYTDRNGDTRVVEYRSNKTRALPATRRQLLLVDQPYPNHNGGQLAFGPDGRLYVGMGDGGAAGDPEDRAQDMGSRLGKLLRIDVDGPLRVGIAALGLRNPWRFSFDRANGDLYIGDVGQGSWEEIDYLPRARLGTLINYGWDVYEGRAGYEDKELSTGTLVQPIAVYGRSQGYSVSGGFVYRGSSVPAFRGRYFYGDYGSGAIWSLRVVNGKATGLRKEGVRVEGLSSFGEDAAGELYAVSLGGNVYRLGR
jgi:glucose/arabinose dehydrogenase